MTKLLCKDLVDGQGKGFLPEIAKPHTRASENADEYEMWCDGYNRCLLETANQDLMPFIQASCEAVLCDCVRWNYRDQVLETDDKCECKGTGAVIRKREGKNE